MFYLYRKASNRVISVSDNTFTVFGDQYAEFNTPTKIVTWPMWCDGTVVRTATEQEIAAFTGLEKAADAEVMAVKFSAQVTDGSRPDVLAMLDTIAEVTGKTAQELLAVFNDKLNSYKDK